MRSNKCVFTPLGASNHVEEERQVQEYYATDPKALELILPHITLHENVWECACGGGHLSEVLKRNGYKVYSTDLVDRGYQDRVIDFLKADKPFCGDILTNPPYKYAQEFVEHALELLHKGNKLIMFLKVLFLESNARKKLFKKYPPKEIWVSSNRINCYKNGDFSSIGSSAVAYAWFVWEKGYTGDTIIKWFN